MTRECDDIPAESIIAMAPVALFGALLFLVTLWLVAGWRRNTGELLFVLAVAWVPTALIARGAWGLHQIVRRRGARMASMFVPWLAVFALALVAYALVVLLFSH